MEKLLDLKTVSKTLGVSVKTLQRWDAQEKIKVVRTPGGRRRIPESEVHRILGSNNQPNRKLAIYGRVSSNEQKQKGDLERQIQFVQEKMEKLHFSSIITFSDVGSGLNDKRKGLLKIMDLAKKGEITDVAIRYRDRLTRFGYGYLEEYFKSHNVMIHILDEKENTKSIQEELADDLMDIITSFSGKLYGLRSKKQKELQKTVEEEIIRVPNIQNKTSEHECSE